MRDFVAGTHEGPSIPEVRAWKNPCLNSGSSRKTRKSERQGTSGSRLIDACPAQSYFLHEDAHKQSEQKQGTHSLLCVWITTESPLVSLKVGPGKVPLGTTVFRVKPSGASSALTMSKLNTFCAPRAAVGSSNKAANRRDEAHIVRTPNKLSLKIAVGYVSPFIPFSRPPRPCGRLLIAPCGSPGDNITYANRERCVSGLNSRSCRRRSQQKKSVPWIRELWSRNLCGRK